MNINQYQTAKPVNIGQYQTCIWLSHPCHLQFAQSFHWKSSFCFWCLRLCILILILCRDLLASLTKSEHGEPLEHQTEQQKIEESFTNAHIKSMLWLRPVHMCSAIAFIDYHISFIIMPAHLKTCQPGRSFTSFCCHCKITPWPYDLCISLIDITLQVQWIGCVCQVTQEINCIKWEENRNNDQKNTVSDKNGIGISAVFALLYIAFECAQVSKLYCSLHTLDLLAL